MKRWLVSINKKFTKELVEYIEVEAYNEIAAIFAAFDLRPQYNGDEQYGEAIEL